MESAEKLAFISDNSSLECDFIAKKNFLHNRCFSLNYSKYWITDNTVLTWTMLRYARPLSTSTNARKILPEVSKYLAKMAPYSPFVIADNYNNSSPSARWIAGEKMGFDKELVLLASSLVGACPSSSGVERCFSIIGFTYGKLRSQLAVVSAEKLAFISDNSILEGDFIAK